MAKTLYRKRITLTGNEESRKRAVSWIKENGSFMGTKALDGVIMGAYYFMNTGAAIGYELRPSEISAEVFSDDERAGKDTLAGLVAVSEREF